MEGGQEEKRIIDEWTQRSSSGVFEKAWRGYLFLDGNGAVTQQHITIQMEIRARGRLYLIGINKAVAGCRLSPDYQKRCIWTLTCNNVSVWSGLDI